MDRTKLTRVWWLTFYWNKVQFATNLNLKLPEVGPQHANGADKNLSWVLLTSFSMVKRFCNQLRFDEVTTISWWSIFGTQWIVFIGTRRFYTLKGKTGTKSKKMRK